MSIAVNYAVLAKGWERFTIMHKDRKVAAIREDGSEIEDPVAIRISRAFIEKNKKRAVQETVPLDNSNMHKKTPSTL